MIVSDANIMMGKPVIAGTRLTVELILERLAAGESVEQLLEGYPKLSRNDIADVQDFVVIPQRGVESDMLVSRDPEASEGERSTLAPLRKPPGRG